MTPPSDWKKVLTDTLLKLGIMDKDFTGPIVINCNSGGVNNAEKKVTLK